MKENEQKIIPLFFATLKKMYPKVDNKEILYGSQIPNQLQNIYQSALQQNHNSLSFPREDNPYTWHVRPYDPIPIQQQTKNIWQKALERSKINQSDWNQSQAASNYQFPQQLISEQNSLEDLSTILYDEMQKRNKRMGTYCPYQTTLVEQLFSPEMINLAQQVLQQQKHQNYTQENIRKKLAVWLIQTLEYFDFSFTTAGEIMRQFLDTMKYTKQKPTSAECLFNSQFRTFFPENGKKAFPNINLTYIENQTIPIDPQRTNRAAVRIENEDYYHELPENANREQKQPDYYLLDRLRKRLWC